MIALEDAQKNGLSPGDKIIFRQKDIGAEWAKEISNMKLEPGVTLNLSENNIGDE